MNIILYCDSCTVMTNLISTKGPKQLSVMSEVHWPAMFGCDMSARASVYEIEVFLPSLIVIHLLTEHIGRFLANGSFD